jgi:hypothetical protein
MRISADIPNISAAHKNCVEARMADKAADMGHFDEFKDSAGNKASSAVEAMYGCERRFSLLKHSVILFAIKTKNSHVLPSYLLAYVKRTWMPPSAVQIVIDQKQLENMEHFSCLVSMITNDARCTREIT